MSINRQRAARFRGGKQWRALHMPDRRQRNAPTPPPGANVCMGALLAPAVFFSAAADAGPRRGEWFASVAVARFDTSSDYDFGFASGAPSASAMRPPTPWRPRSLHGVAGVPRHRSFALDHRAVDAVAREKPVPAFVPICLPVAAMPRTRQTRIGPPGAAGNGSRERDLFGSLGEHVHWRGDLRGCRHQRLRRRSALYTTWTNGFVGRRQIFRPAAACRDAAARSSTTANAD